VSNATGAGGYLDVLAKAGIFGVVMAMILAVARGGRYTVSGLLVSVPAVSLYTWWWINAQAGPAAVKAAVRAAMWSAVPWVAYLAVVHLLAGRVPMWAALGLGVLTWFGLFLVFATVLRGRG